MKPKKPRMKKLVIKRSKWLRGDPDKSLLLDTSGRMCCLGFYTRACGLPAKAVRGIATPANLDRLPGEASWLVDMPFGLNYNSTASMRLMRDNDEVTLGWRDREAKIREVFAKHGVKVVFVP